MIEQRSSGILMHITSLPSQYGIGDLGPNAYRFADFLAQSGQKWWQVLPLNPTTLSRGSSPYSSPSAFAGNTLIISPAQLISDGYLSKEELPEMLSFSKKAVCYNKVTSYKKAIINKAFQNYNKTSLHQKDFENFKARNHWWVDDYALFIALSKHYHTDDWNQWPEALKRREQDALLQHHQQLTEEVEQERFAQFLFFRQWYALKNYCAKQNIMFIGDLPFYIDYNSVDVWANQHYFKLGKNGYPYVVSGVPPDYFSKTGQLWGSPVYDWECLKANHFDWWVSRVDKNMELFDLIRIDHFRAFSAYWEVSAQDENAVNGSYHPVPGKAFFELIESKYNRLPFIAEDLGDIDQPVRDLISHFKLPNMKLLLFAFGENMADNPFIPHHHYKNCVVYTGTHDNNTVRGWFNKEAGKAGKRRLRAYSGRIVTRWNVHEVMMRLAMQSVANLVILPIQDVLGLDEKHIMNTPGTVDGNWIWRLKNNHINKKTTLHLKRLVQLFAR